MKLYKWSEQWLASLTIAQLAALKDIARANAIVCDESAHSAVRSFKWAHRENMVDNEIERRNNALLSM